MDIHPYLIVPNLIPQPTWGGEYIANLKQISNSKLNRHKLGQSYELFSNSKLSVKTSTHHQPSIEFGNPSHPGSTQLIKHHDQPFFIADLIKVAPKNTLGSRALKLQGDSIDILIKLTQAQQNSYQLHVKKQTQEWQPKPESWYFLQPGLITLGVKPDIDLTEYQQVCQNIHQEAQRISKQICHKKLSLERATSQLKQLIAHNHPQHFVNRISVAKHAAIDLSLGGIHHSWESNPQTHPQGNIVYELQKNVFDPVSTIRCFDQGKIKPDGTIRPLQINDYFKHIDSTPLANRPENLLTKPKTIKRASTYSIRQIFNINQYRLQELTLSQPISNSYTNTSDSYHHLFASQGNFRLIWRDQSWTVTAGFSIFVPALVGRYILKPHKSRHVQILKTYL